MLGEKAVVRRRERQLWNAPRAPFFTHTLKVQSLRHCAGHLGSVISVRRPRRAGSYDFMVQKNFISSYLRIDMGRTQLLTFSIKDMGRCAGNVLSFTDCWSSKRITQVGIN